MKKQRVLIGCEFSGIVRDAFIERGHDAVSCDLIPSERPGPHITGDVLNWLDDEWDMLVAFPPCTYLAGSGARWWAGRQQEQRDAIDFFMQLANAPIDKIAIENPVGIMSTIYRKPNQYIQPWQHGHGETKKTGLWLKNLPILKPSNVVDGRTPRVHFMAPGKDRSKNRSRTPIGVAESMAAQWSD